MDNGQFCNKCIKKWILILLKIHNFENANRLESMLIHRLVQGKGEQNNDALPYGTYKWQLGRIYFKFCMS